MANPKITISLDQSIVDALNRFCESAEKISAALARMGSTFTAETDAAQAHVQNTDVETNQTVPETPIPAIPEPSVPEPSVPVSVIPEPAAPTFVLPTAQMNPVAPQANPVQAIPVQSAPMTPPPVQMPTQAQEITMERLAMAGAELMQKGFNATAILAEFGVKAVSELPKEQYGAFALRLRQLGANI